MSFSANYPTSAPSLMLDFANSNAVDPRVTFTRASTATYFDSIGTLQSAAVNSPRLDYNPSTLAAQGLLIEEARTNSIRNNTMVGAVAGTPGTLPTNWLEALTSGLTRQVVGTGTEDGVAYIDIRVSGTAGAATSLNYGFETATQIAAATGQTWTASAYLKLSAGSLSGISSVTQRVIERTVAGVLVQTDTSPSITLTSTLTRHQAAVTLSGGATVERLNSYIYLTPLNGAAIDITLRIGLPQLEQGAFATSVIPTTTTALTRAADVASVNTLSPWFNATEGTIYFEGQGAVVNGYSFSLFGSNTQNRIFASYTTSDRMQAGTRESGTLSLANSLIGSAPLNTTGKGALAYKVGDAALSWNGGAVVATSPQPTALPTILRLDLGNNGSLSGNWLNGYLRRITYYPRKLSSAELQAITA